MFLIWIKQYVTDNLMKLDQSEDNQIANIYEKMLKGDKSALNNLQKINNSPIKKKTEAPNRQLISIEEKSEKKPEDINKASRTQNFKKYLNQKGAQFNSVNEGSKKQLRKNQKEPQKKQYIEAKPFAKVHKRSDVKSQQKGPQIASTKQIIQIEQVRKKEKTKTTFANFQQNINKNIIKDSATEKDKQSAPPSSNHSFRVRLQGGSKKLLEQLIKINEQERKLQLQILQLHKQNKQYIAQVCQKYRIHQLDKNYPKIVQTIQDYQSFSIDSPSIIKIKQKSANISAQQQKIMRLQKQITVLSTQIEKKKTESQKKEAKLEGLPLYSYLNSVPDIFEEQRESQQDEEVGELPGQNKNIDPTKTYQSLMVQMRKKKWGLNQRINYQSEGSKNNQSKLEVGKQKSIQKVQQSSPHKIEGQKDSKIIVNSRLKQFLFE